MGVGIAGCASDNSGNGLFGDGGADEDAGAHFKSGVNGSTPLGSLTPDQKVTICEKQAHFVRARLDTTSLARFICSLDPAVLFAASDDACEAALDKCVAPLSVKVDVSVETDPEQEKVACSDVPISQCQGSVTDYENCVDSVANVQLVIGSGFACGTRAQYMTSPTAGVDACKALGPNCTAAVQPVVK